MYSIKQTTTRDCKQVLSKRPIIFGSEVKAVSLLQTTGVDYYDISVDESFLYAKAL